METVTITVCQSDQLDCAVDEGVLIKVDPTLLAVNAGQLEEDWKYYLLGTIASITDNNTCGYVYVLEYDETLLVDPETPLTTDDVEKVCCESCYGQYFRDTILNVDVDTSINSDDTIDGDGGVLAPLSVNVSADSGNVVSIGTDGKVYCDVSLGAIGGAVEDTAEIIGQVFGSLLINIGDNTGLMSGITNSLTVSNPATETTMLVLIASELRFSCNVFDSTQDLLFRNSIDPGTGVYENLDTVLGLSRLEPIGCSTLFFKFATIAPGGSKTIRNTMYLEKLDSGGSIQNIIKDIKLSVLGVYQ